MTEPTHQVIVHRLAMSDLEFAYTYVWKTAGTHASAWYSHAADWNAKLVCPQLPYEENMR